MEVIVQSGTPWWVAWVPIAISLLSLAVSGSQFVINRAERKRIMPTIKMSVMYTDKMYWPGRENTIRAVMVSVDNLGREGTTLNFIIVHSKNAALNGLNMLLDEPGEASGGKPGAVSESLRTIPGFSRVQYPIDAETLTQDEVLVTATFGHGEKIVLLACLNDLAGNGKPLNRSQIEKWQAREANG